MAHSPRELPFSYLFFLGVREVEGERGFLFLSHRHFLSTAFKGLEAVIGKGNRNAISSSTPSFLIKNEGKDEETIDGWIPGQTAIR